MLIVLQALDAGGKDGTIRKVFTAFNPQGTVVTGFGVPTEEELAHDFLWRIHAHTPGRGPHRHLQPQPLRGRAGGPGAGAGARRRSGRRATTRSTPSSTSSPHRAR